MRVKNSLVCKNKNPRFFGDFFIRAATTITGIRRVTEKPRFFKRGFASFRAIYPTTRAADSRNSANASSVGRQLTVEIGSGIVHPILVRTSCISCWQSFFQP